MTKSFIMLCKRAFEFIKKDSNANSLSSFRQKMMEDIDHQYPQILSTWTLAQLTAKYFPNLDQSNRIWIVLTFFRFFGTKHTSVRFQYNLIWFDLSRIREDFTVCCISFQVPQTWFQCIKKNYIGNFISIFLYSRKEKCPPLSRIHYQSNECVIRPVNWTPT